MSVLGGLLHFVFPKTFENLAKYKTNKARRAAAAARMEETKKKLKELARQEKYDKKLRRLMDIAASTKITPEDYEKEFDKIVAAYGNEKQLKSLQRKHKKALEGAVGGSDKVPYEDMEEEDRKTEDLRIKRSKIEADEKRKQEKHALDMELKKKKLEGTPEKDAKTEEPEKDSNNQDTIDFYEEKSKKLSAVAKKLEDKVSSIKKSIERDKAGGYPIASAAKELEKYSSQLEKIESWMSYYDDVVAALDDGDDEETALKVTKSGKPSGKVPNLDVVELSLYKPKAEVKPKEDETSDEETPAEDKPEETPDMDLKKPAPDATPSETGSGSSVPEKTIEVLKDKVDTKLSAAEEEKKRKEEKLKELQRRIDAKRKDERSRGIMESTINEAEESKSILKLKASLDRYSKWIKFWKELKMLVNRKGVTKEELMKLKEKKPDVSAPRPSRSVKNENYENLESLFFVEENSVTLRNNISWYC